MLIDVFIRSLIVLIEKLLRTTDVESIYILIRNKKDDDIHTRVGKIFDDPVRKHFVSFYLTHWLNFIFSHLTQIFDTMKSHQPKFRHKIIVIAGDCMLPGLGIDPNDRAMLIKHVNIVFHVAATVR